MIVTRCTRILICVVGVSSFFGGGACNGEGQRTAEEPNDNVEEWSMRFEGLPESIPAANEKKGVLLIRQIPSRLDGSEIEIEVRRNGVPLRTMVLIPQNGQVGMIVPSGEYVIDALKMPSAQWAATCDPNTATTTVHSGRVTSLTLSGVGWPRAHNSSS